eukprot:TRINITY_DN2330_c0_g1_i1.p1 TRINITY_DN2330_c0_g1~~TRINITY_DN2330_c0_g1_i1.p1  ORF type:complete len:371 (-),score=104.92 TRINITY_DN2330_c0_g1_i1:224-1171(-)
MALNVSSLDTQHSDMIHDAQFDFYGKRLATCSSDRLIKIFEVEGDTQTHVVDLKGHEGPVWQVAWAHPKFGNLLASCSYDKKVIVWKETSRNTWVSVHEYVSHELSVNSVAWAPHEFGVCLACASSDGNISVLTQKGDVWDDKKFFAHGIGVNAVSWAPAVSSGSLVNPTTQAPTKRLVSGGCDKLIKIWRYSENESQWVCEFTIEGHSDWVRDVAWAPNIGLPVSTIASCSQDNTVMISTKADDSNVWTKTTLPNFSDVVWRVSWSVTGNILAVSCGDNKVTLWKESLNSKWECISKLVDDGSGLTSVDESQST